MRYLPFNLEEAQAGKPFVYAPFHSPNHKETAELLMLVKNERPYVIKVTWKGQEEVFNAHIGELYMIVPEHEPFIKWQVHHDKSDEFVIMYSDFLLDPERFKKELTALIKRYINSDELSKSSKESS